METLKKIAAIFVIGISVPSLLVAIWCVLFLFQLLLASGDPYQQGFPQIPL